MSSPDEARARRQRARQADPEDPRSQLEAARERRRLGHHRFPGREQVQRMDWETLAADRGVPVLRRLPDELLGFIDGDWESSDARIWLRRTLEPDRGPAILRRLALPFILGVLERAHPRAATGILVELRRFAESLQDDGPTELDGEEPKRLREALMVGRPLVVERLDGGDAATRQQAARLLAAMPGGLGEQRALLLARIDAPTAAEERPGVALALGAEAFARGHTEADLARFEALFASEVLADRIAGAIALASCLGVHAPAGVSALLTDWLAGGCEAAPGVEPELVDFLPVMFPEGCEALNAVLPDGSLAAAEAFTSGLLRETASESPWRRTKGALAGFLTRWLTDRRCWPALRPSDLARELSERQRQRMLQRLARITERPPQAAGLEFEDLRNVLRIVIALETDADWPGPTPMLRDADLRRWFERARRDLPSSRRVRVGLEGDSAEGVPGDE